MEINWKCDMYLCVLTHCWVTVSAVWFPLFTLPLLYNRDWTDGADSAAYFQTSGHIIHAGTLFHAASYNVLDCLFSCQVRHDEAFILSNRLATRTRSLRSLRRFIQTLSTDRLIKPPRRLSVCFRFPKGFKLTSCEPRITFQLARHGAEELCGMWVVLGGLF